MAAKTAAAYLNALSSMEVCFLGIEWGVIDIEEVKQRLLDEYEDKILEEMGQDEDE